MKILASAITCNPVSGSEAHVGWSAVTTMARDHEIWVLTQPWNRPLIEQAAERGEVPANLQFRYLSTDGKPPHPSFLVARVLSWADYLKWNRLLVPAAMALHREIGFDLVHHVTYSAWRIPSPLWRLPVPLVWGPVGGVASMPRAFLGLLSPKNRAFEQLRSLSNTACRAAPALRNCLRHAAAVVASNFETRRFLEKVAQTRNPIEVLSATILADEQIRAFRSAPDAKPASGPLQLFAGGNLIGTKGIVLALRALRIVRDRGIPFRYVIGGRGPEYARIASTVDELGLSDAVVHGESFSGAAYAEMLAQSHIYLLPSFRENAPVTILQAMLAGCVPVVVKASAQGEIVDDTCGCAVPVTRPQEVVAGLADAICRLASDRRLLAQLATNAQARVLEGYNADRYRTAMNAIYARATGR